jgi:hypothetical protein
MDGHRINGRSQRTGPTRASDASLDREIESLLGAEPSPEFVARVRARIAEEPAPGRWRAWMIAVPAAAVVAIAVLIVWPSREQAPAHKGPRLYTSQQAAQAAEAVQPAIPPAASSEASRARRRSTPRSPLSAATAIDRAMDIDLPEVVIAENEVRTFASLVASIRQRRFDVAVPAAPDLDAPIEIRELPSIEPIEIEPIVKLAALQAEGERP